MGVGIMSVVYVIVIRSDAQRRFYSAFASGSTVVNVSRVSV